MIWLSPSQRQPDFLKSRRMQITLSPKEIAIREKSPVSWLHDVFQWLISAFHQSESQLMDEQRIIEKCKENPDYFAPIYEKYFDQIFTYVYKRVEMEEVCGDITSRVFFKSLSHIGKYKYQGVPFSAWLYRIAINEINEYFRNQKKESRVVSLETAHIGKLFEEIEIAEDMEPEEMVGLLLQELSPEDVQFIELRFFENHSFRDMGFLLGISEVNAKVKTYRILKKLKDIAEKLRIRN